MANLVARTTVALPEGAELTVYAASASDLPAVVELHEACSARSRYRRYLGGAVPSPTRLARLLEPPGGVTLLAATCSDGPPAVVAMANLIAEGVQAEAALLVRDDWQRRGLGSALLFGLLRHARVSGYAALVLHIHAENTPMLRTLKRLDRPTLIDRDGALVTFTVPVTTVERERQAR
ncbi:L-amino acid N-acyltransferase YncA [Micromonospora nigra]|uniref:L-amino acid N-acyltransferase YncA n=1 Tax=Micromonospora nigra TaxID=145857 RepID=A0A1C6R7J4_9ACTN|nr:GNAT family N-acetyltransferase [Micromonospora nigra]SCL12997.1 L-amino acid N-acyltransferase YncA [Micromonospora nigra]